MVLLLTWERNKQTDSQWSLCAVLPSINLWDDQPSFLPEHEGQPSCSDLLIKQLSLCGWGDELCVFYEPVVNTDIFTPYVVSNFTLCLDYFLQLSLEDGSHIYCMFAAELLVMTLSLWFLKDLHWFWEKNQNYRSKHDESWLSKTIIMQVYTVNQLSGRSGTS